MRPCCIIGIFTLIFTGPSKCGAQDAATAFAARALPVLKARCGDCHGADKPQAKINLTATRTSEDLASERDVWFRVLIQLDAGTMPPEGEPALSTAERQAIAGWIRGELTALLADRQMQQGRSKLRRLSRNEYANTVEDLFGVRPVVGQFLPEDGRVDGYDKVAVALPLSAEGALGYFTMAEDLVKRWVLRPPPRVIGGAPYSRLTRAEAMESGQSPGHSLRLEDNTIVSFNSDTTSGRLNFRGVKTPGVHRVRVSVYGYQTDKPLPFGIYVGNTAAYPQVLELATVLEAPPGKAAVLETEFYLRNNIGMRLIPFGIGVQVPKNSLASLCRGPGLAVQWMEDEEPEQPLVGDHWLTADFPEALEAELRNPRKVILQPTGPKNSQAKSVTRDEFLAVMRTTFRRVGSRLFRRDLADVELDEIVQRIGAQLDAGVSLDAAFLDQVIELMTAPEFLCVIEQPGELSDFALASRLSYFLWNSTPDETLLDVAREGRLRDPQVLREQTERLLADPRSDRFVAYFTAQWLNLRAIDDTSPDAHLYPEYDELLKYSSVMETRGFFRRLLDENLGVRHLVASPWVLVNERLAEHYGLPGVHGVELRAVQLPAGSPLGGIWTQSAVMKVTANGTNTSPVKRGVWVAERLLGTPIPPPPPNINPVEPDIRGAKTLREQLALHRSGGACAACHARFDPYGFALESFDVTGGFREHYRVTDPEITALPPGQRRGRSTWRDGLPVDCSGRTPDGQAFDGIVGLRQILAENPEQLARGVARHLATYSTGAPVTGLDQAAIDQIVAQTEAHGYGLRSLIHALVQSQLFRWK